MKDLKMNIRLLAPLFIFSAYISFVAVPSAAENQKQQSKARVKQAAAIQSLQRGPSFTSNNQSYQYLPEVRGVRLKSGEPPQQALRRVGVAATQYLATATKGPYALYRGARHTTAQLGKNQGDGTFPAAINKRDKTIGILPGTIEVKPRSMDAVAAIAATHGLRVLREFAHLKVVYYQANPGQDILAIAAALAADSRVLSAEIEVIEHFAEPN